MNGLLANHNLIKPILSSKPDQGGTNMQNAQGGGSSNFDQDGTNLQNAQNDGSSNVDQVGTNIKNPQDDGSSNFEDESFSDESYDNDVVTGTVTDIHNIINPPHSIDSFFSTCFEIKSAIIL